MKIYKREIKECGPTCPNCYGYESYVTSLEPRNYVIKINCCRAMEKEAYFNYDENFPRECPLDDK